MPFAYGHTPSDPNFLKPDFFQDWKTLQTAHFRIHHQAAHKEYAQQMGAVAERVHERLGGWLGWEPAEKTEVVILDSVDLSNGAATPRPYNQFYIYLPTPVEGEIMDNNPWMEWVFTHEYVHILHLDMVSGAPQVVRDVFGRVNVIPFVPLAFPQIFGPSWVTEGLAVYGESDNGAGYGRLNNAWFEAEMRMEVERGLRSLTQESFEGYSGSRWPRGQNYLYGAYFFKFVEERYGRDKVAGYIRVYGGNVIPWRMDKRAKQIFGKPAQVVWEEFQDYLKQRFEPQLATIRQKSAITSHVVYDAPYVNNLLTAAGNGDLYFYHNDDASHPAVRRIRPDGTNEQVFEAEEVQHLDWQDHAGLLLSKLTVCDNTNAYADLYRWQPGMPAPIRLTHCGRYPRAAWRADGGAIAAVQLDHELSRLVLLDAEGTHREVLAELPAGDALGHVAWSPDGKRIAASVKRLRTGWHLELLELDTRQWQELTLNHDREIRPRFSRDGSEIYFLSDHDKIWNLRRIRLGSDAVETLSNTLSGISESVQLPDKSYRLVEYTAQGLAITALEQPAGAGAAYSARSGQAPEVKAIATAPDYQPAPYQDVTDYSALTTLAPRSWLPIASFNANNTSYVGVMLNGSDILGFHHWVATPYYYLDQQTLGGLGSYDFYNHLTFSVLRQLFALGSANAAALYRDDELRYQMLAHHSFNSFDSDWYVATGIGGERIKIDTFAGAPTIRQTRDTLAGAITRYDSTEYYRRSISHVDGRSVQMSGESYDAFRNNDHRGKTYRLDWREYFGLGQNHALLLRWQQAYGDPGIRPYVLGGETPPLNPLNADVELGRRNINLRGYPSGLASLIGTHFVVATAEYRIPLGLYYDGFFVPPLGVGRQSLSVFVDRGDAWSAGERIQLKTGAGLEWNVETLIGYDQIHLGITAGYAHGFDKVEGGNRLYFRLGMAL